MALDPVSDVAPVRMMQALQGSIETLQAQAARIVNNEQTPTIADSDGALQPVTDEGGRHCLESVVLDLRTIAGSFNETTEVELEMLRQAPMLA